MLSKVYTIDTKGLKLCPKEETFVEKHSVYEHLQNTFLRLLRDTGPKTEKEIYSHFTPGYNADQIKHMLNLTRYAGLVDIHRRIL